MTTTNYDEAYEHARQRATESGADYGIERTKHYGRTTFVVSRLPAERFRQGYELRVEVVAPGSPRCL